ncbi:hypothetical protein [Halopiger goleimassiliensis]|uniref:hypothetical protein n=1 Tax=Halopiger goleimassiliensis TaxID=1293048 RepID=UPI000A943E0D|nr:hypothetical protein [Halopiger goleimassiliensis]
MSAEQRSPDPDPSLDDASGAVDAGSTTPSSGNAVRSVELEFRSEPRSDDDRPRAAPAESLPDRIERQRLRLQVAALERELRASERRRRSIVTRYEQLLAERTGNGDESTASDDATATALLKRILERRR